MRVSAQRKTRTAKGYKRSERITYIAVPLERTSKVYLFVLRSEILCSSTPAWKKFPRRFIQKPTRRLCLGKLCPARTDNTWNVQLAPKTKYSLLNQNAFKTKPPVWFPLARSTDSVFLARPSGPILLARSLHLCFLATLLKNLILGTKCHINSTGLVPAIGREHRTSGKVACSGSSHKVVLTLFSLDNVWLYPSQDNSLCKSLKFSRGKKNKKDTKNPPYALVIRQK